MFKFAQPYNSIWFIGIGVIILMFVIADIRRRRTLEKLGNVDIIRRAILFHDPAKRNLRRVCLLLGYVFVVLALMRPQLGTKVEKVQKRGIDIVFALDVSKSMYAEDLKPNRLANAKAEIKAFIERQANDRLALTVFSGQGFLMCPLTVDYDAFLMFLAAADPSVVSPPGTNLADAVDKSLAAFIDDQPRYKAIILISDGEQTVPGDPIDAAKKAAEGGAKIFAVGIGTPTGTLIPIRDERGNVVSYQTDAAGGKVTTRLDEATLAQMAEVSGGKYFLASPGRAELREIFSEIDKMGQKDLGDVVFSQFEERFYVPLGVAIVFLTLFWVISERRTRVTDESGNK